MDFPPPSQFSEFLSLAHISDADVCKAIKRLKPSKSVGFGDIPCFIIKAIQVFLLLFLETDPAVFSCCMARNCCCSHI
jgi:hypothetical protein